MNIQTLSFIQVSDQAEKVLEVGKKHHWRLRIITDFHGVIDKPVFNTQGDWVYMPMREEDRLIIPKAAYRRHQAVEKAGFRVAQIIIGHEIVVAPDMPATQTRVPPADRKIDWSRAAQVAGKGLLVGMMGIAMVSFYALIGAVQLLDPSYCIVLDEPEHTVVELIRWNQEV